MKKTDIAIALTFIIVISLVVVWFFSGVRVTSEGNNVYTVDSGRTVYIFNFNAGSTTYPSHATPPSANATLWEKAEWSERHGSIRQSLQKMEFSSPIVLQPARNASIGIISFNLSQPGHVRSPPVNMTNARITLSTKNEERTVLLSDSSVRSSFAGSISSESSASLLSHGSVLYIDLDTQKMGFTTIPLGPGERFSLIITPENEERIGITREIPARYSPAAPLEIPL